MDWPPVNDRPLHAATASSLVEVSVDGIQTTACGGAAVLRILGERYGTLNTITGGEGGYVCEEGERIGGGREGEREKRERERERVERVKVLINLSTWHKYCTRNHTSAVYTS